MKTCNRISELTTESIIGVEGCSVMNHCPRCFGSAIPLDKEKPSQPGCPCKNAESEDPE